MVSTRGFKARFCEGERVLCYEPDPTKAKVLYESKVLQIVYNKDTRGKKQIEYLIHFQGWNASWDRCVDEDLVLKDTDENRELQRRLMEEAQIKLKEKKKKRRLSDTIREIVQEKQKKERGGSEAGSQLGTGDDDDQYSVTSDADSGGASWGRASAREGDGGGGESCGGPDQSGRTPGVTDPSVQDYLKEFPLDIPAALKAVLERDHCFIKEKKKLVRLPCPPAALTVLESYVIFFASRYLARTSERRRRETRLKDKAYLTLSLCKEVMDGLRVLFDFHLRTHLLYGEETTQAAALAACSPPQYLLKSSAAPTLGDDSSGQEDVKMKPTEDKTLEEGGGGGGRRMTRSSGGRNATEATAPSPYACESGRSTPVTTSSSDGALQHHAAAGEGGDGGSAEGGLSSGPLLSSLGPLSQELVQWTLLPGPHRRPGTPVLLYGPLHLLRLFVKLPEILYRMNLPLEKRKIVLKHLQLFLEYLEVHSQEFFSESLYVSNSSEKC